MKRQLAAVVAALAVGAVGCSSGHHNPYAGPTDGPGAPAAVKPASGTVTQQDVINALHLAKYTGTTLGGDVDWVYTNGPTSCYVLVILTTPAAVNTYASAGDDLATNDSQSVGIKFMGGADGSQPDMIPACGKLMSADLQRMGQ